MAGLGLDPYNLAIYDLSIPAGHAITPYAIQDMGGDNWRVYVYDNNHPNDSDRFVTINTAGDTWSYDLGGTIGTWSGDGDDHSLAVVPISTYGERPVCPWCDAGNSARAANTSTSTVSLNGAGQLMVSTSSGQIGYSGSAYTNTIPGAYRNLLLNGLGRPAEPEFVLSTGDSKLSLSGQSGIMTDTVRLLQVGPDYALAADGIALTETTSDTMQTSPAIGHVSYSSQYGAEPTLRLALESPADSHHIRLVSVDIGAGQTVSATANASEGNLYFSNRHASGGEYDFRYRRANTSGPAWFQHNGIIINPLDTHILSYGAWDVDESMLLSIDAGSDGVIDQTILLEDQSPLVFVPIVLR
jgi:hypothetical protein